MNTLERIIYIRLDQSSRTHYISTLVLPSVSKFSSTLSLAPPKIIGILNRLSIFFLFINWTLREGVCRVPWNSFAGFGAEAEGNFCYYKSGPEGCSRPEQILELVASGCEMRYIE